MYRHRLAYLADEVVDGRLVADAIGEMESSMGNAAGEADRLRTDVGFAGVDADGVAEVGYAEGYRDGMSDALEVLKNRLLYAGHSVY